MNFSVLPVWNDSTYLRYPIDKVKKIGNLYFYEEDDILKCQHFFQFDISCDEFGMMKKEVLNMKKLKFNYIDNSEMLDKIHNWANSNNFVYEVVDSWENPKLIMDNNIVDYFKYNSNSQIKRNYKYYDNNKNNFKFTMASSDNVLSLWESVLKIDFNSWKRTEHSDMKSLNREDLQYLPFLLTNRTDSSLCVVYDFNNVPLAYSLMFKGEDEFWFAVKWGASSEGRKKYAGIVCLFNHLEHLYSKYGKVKVDFWGRRNATYDYLKNQSIIRNHILIYKKED